MSNLILIFLCLLPFSPFLFMGVDLWHGTGQFIQVGILALFCYSFIEKPNPVKIKNIALASFLLWAGVITSYYWINIFSTTKHYPIKLFFPFFNLLCLVLFYKIIVEYLDSGRLEKIIKYFRYSAMLLLVYCFLQMVSLDQFLRGLDVPEIDRVVGTIGNQSHLAGLLAIVQPIFFNKRLEDIFSLILLWIILISLGSASGLVCGIAVVIFWLFFKNRKAGIIAMIIAVMLLTYIFIRYNSFFAANGRYEIWVKIFGIFKNKAITGSGLGAFGALQLKNNAGIWQHLHNEYYQIAFELGIVGLVLLLWCIFDYFKSMINIKSGLSIKLGSIFFGFCLLGLFTFNAHLWQISMLGMLSYAGIYVIKNEVLNGNSHKIGYTNKGSN